MATLELSATAMITGITLQFTSGSSYTLTQTTSLAAGSFFPYSPVATYPTSVNGIHIMQGTIPTNFSGFTTYTASGRASDELMYFNSTDDFIVGTSGNRATISTNLKAATASGTAAWFWAIGTMSNSTPTATIYQQFIGTVGVSGSGADLTITDTNIVSGNLYRISSLIINVPSTYTV